ncbi:MAG: bifunctional cbb3-type cytochrome C oxidase subunit I/II [Phycisphaeraceae bacterium]|nr:MAG: bifunctional cbb3-type cytochrome C oxidase subunit I/II [Phycisphaeraceae bacterium]
MDQAGTQTVGILDPRVEPELESFSYDDQIVRMFTLATLAWGIVAFLAGVLIATLMAYPSLVPDLQAISVGGFEPFAWLPGGPLSFGRLRPLHTNAAIFAFAGNGIFAAIYYSTQRLCKARMFSDLLGRLHFWGWQLIIVSAAVTLPLGMTQGKEYAELEWPIDLLIAIVWVGFFGVNFFMTLARRRERHLYVALWFYIATIVTVALLHVFNNLWVPAGIVHWARTGEAPSPDLFMKSYPVYAGVQDALMQWWYGHNAVAFFLTTPFLGLMYYFLPKAANRPVFSYRLSIIHFWSLVFIYIWAGPHHLHWTALPEWASTLGMIFSVMLWMPSWGGMINGLLTLRGAWHKVATDPVLKFFVVGITFYGMSTFEGPLLSIKAVNSLSHYTDWTIAHVHSGALGWNGFMTFGMIYWLMPRLFQTELYSKKLAALHFWIATIGMVLYVLAIYAAGITQGLMWRAFDATGRLTYPDFVETVTVLIPMYWIRVIGGVLYLSGALIGAWNMYKTWKSRPRSYEVPVHSAPRLSAEPPAYPRAQSRMTNVVGLGHASDKFLQALWHRRLEGMTFKFTVWVIIAVSIGGIIEAIPMFLVRSNVPSIASVQPYTPLELTGRDIYIAEGCYNCHSQMIRPFYWETKRYGEYSKPGEFVYDHPFQWGSRRIGPDLAREGGRKSDIWHWLHFEDPRNVTPNSIMPAYTWLLEDELRFDEIQGRVDAMAMLGVPYGDAVLDGAAPEMAREQAAEIAARLEGQGGPPAADTQRTKAIALIAYMQRLGTDLYREPPVAQDEEVEDAAD